MKGLLTLNTLSVEKIQEIIDRAEEFKQGYQLSFSNKKVATLFFENSTRTHYSFHCALVNLGINVIDINTQGSSVAKGETVKLPVNRKHLSRRPPFLRSCVVPHTKSRSR